MKGIDRRLKVVVVWLCLMIQIAIGSPILPFAAGVVAWCNGDHQVALSVENDGLKLSLKHEPAGGLSYPTPSTHRHSVSSQFVFLLPSGSESDTADHVIRFAAVNTAVLGGNPVQVAEPSVCVSPVPGSHTLPSPVLVLREEERSRLLYEQFVSDQESASVVVSRFTVLLI